MKGKRAIVSALFVTIAVIVMIMPTRVFILDAGQYGSVFERAGKNGTVTLYFLHSYYHVPQRAYYRHDGSGLALYEMWFGDLQAANYYDPSLAYTRNRDGSYSLTGLDFKVDAVDFAMAHGTDYSISFGDREYDLNDVFPTGTHVKVSAKTVPFFIFIIRGFFHGAN